MAKITHTDGYQVIVNVPVREESGGFFSGTREQKPAQALRSADEIRQAILRHLSHDFAGNWDGVVVAHLGGPVCSHCGATWTEDSADYNGGCCDDDEATQLGSAVAA